MTRNSYALLAAAVFAASMSTTKPASASQIAVSTVPQTTTTTTTTSTTPAPKAGKAAAPAVIQKIEQKSSTTAVASSASASIPNSSENYLDDRLAWPSAIEAKSTLNGTYDQGYCIPGNTKVIGATKAMSTTVQATQDATGKTISSSASQFQEVTLESNSLFWNWFGQPDNVKQSDKSHAGKYLAVPANVSTLCPDVSNPQEFDEGAAAFISSDDMSNATYRAGWRYGALVVPFKMQLSGARAFTGSASLGGYFGYQDPIGDLGVNFTPVFFGGVSNIPSSNSNPSATSSQTVAGLSYGTGVLFDIKDSFHIGFVLGFDHVSSAQKYQYNDKPWISFEIGYSFAN
jgi:hypothetical protein